MSNPTPPYTPQGHPPTLAELDNAIRHQSVDRVSTYIRQGGPVRGMHGGRAIWRTALHAVMTEVALGHVADNARLIFGLLVSAGALPQAKAAVLHTLVSYRLPPGHRWYRPARAMLDAVLQAGVSVDVRNPAGETPLYAAIWHENPVMAQMLLDAGANPALRTRQGLTADQAPTTWHDAARAQAISRAALRSVMEHIAAQNRATERLATVSQPVPAPVTRRRHRA